MAEFLTVSLSEFIAEDNEQESNSITTNENDLGIVKQHYLKVIHNSSISAIASSMYYVDSNATIEELANDFTKDPAIEAVCVVDNNDEIEGIIVRKELMTLLSRPYGRDVLKNHPVKEVMKETRSFFFDSHLLSVAEEIDEDTYTNSITYYTLKTYDNHFAGIFSSRDVLLRLYETTKSDIALARNLQMNIVKENLEMENENFALYGNSIMAKGVGGDFYSIKKFNESRHFISLCDVSGKGVAASLVTSVLGGMVSIYDFRYGIKEFIMKANEYLVTTFNLEKFVTGIFLDLDSSDGKLNLCDMGHSHVYILRKEKLKKLRTTSENLPLGIKKEISPAVFTFQLKPDDIILFFSDGLIEQTNALGEEFSLQHIANILLRNNHSSPAQMHKSMLSAYYEFRGEQPQHDDVTFLILQYK